MRLSIFTGFAVTVFALWQMTQYSLELAESDIVWPGVIQGFGTGLVFVPLSAATFATLSAEMRAQGTSLYSLVRNIGSSIGISWMQTMFTRGSVSAHVLLAERITSANPAWGNPAVNAMFNVHSPRGAALLDAAVAQQAAMIAYIDDFWLLLSLTIFVLPMIFLLKPLTRSAAAVDTHAVMD